MHSREQSHLKGSLLHSNHWSMSYPIYTPTHASAPLPLNTHNWFGESTLVSKQSLSCCLTTIPPYPTAQLLP